ncbi:PH domain-containing protein [Streptomyces adustus]|uniref:PH domain-containing protein n=1 Tax=Streptomyces adustus TaxID=1609272 RepID=A0A5N8V891_9ACTN|nr:PH domain-containing protein [Streptomyces adustus]
MFQTSRDGDFMPRWGRAVYVALMVAIVGWAWLQHARGRTRVGADGITVRGALRERHVPWSDIYDIRAEPFRNRRLDGPLLFAYLYRHDGRRTPLRQMDDWQVADFAAEFEELRGTAVRHRATAWERRPETEELIRLRAGRRRAWEHSVTGALIALAAMFPVMIVRVVIGAAVHPFLLFVCVPAAVFAVVAVVQRRRWRSLVPAYMCEP